jgi:DNA-binding MarR family transcriptional regulator
LVTNPQDCDDLDQRSSLESLPSGYSERLGLLINKLAFELLHRVTPRFDELGIDGKDYALLAVLSEDAVGSQAELAKTCSMLPAQVVPVLDALQAKGWVERKRDERDRRRMIVAITPAGRKLLAKADAATQDVERELMGTDTEDLRERLAESFSAALPGAKIAA